ncbi:hypothetical protein DH2020_029210 [Rehmannia glutinosa]|uniref:Zinc finger BED domain-containing protein RICESLEEPER 2-like n=1 Tax=Rehmannia glutinosa TaxID=99300 RepID=A0ABR0VP74_REHGL
MVNKNGTIPAEKVTDVEIIVETLASNEQERTQESEGINPPRASCNYCGTSYAAHPKLNGTTSMWTHLESSCKKYPLRFDKSQKTMHDYKSARGNQNDNPTIKGKILNLEEVRKNLAKFVIIDGMPFKVVEGEGFRAYSHSLEPRFEVPRLGTCTFFRDCMKVFHEEKKIEKSYKKAKNMLDHRYLDFGDWKLQNLNYMKTIEECLIQWGIDKVFTITVDNASSNDKAVNYLKRKCKWKDVILNNDYMHVRCSAHIVNLIVKEGLEEQNEAIMRVRNAVKYVRSSPSRLNAFKKCVEKEKIDSKSLVCLDVETRWNSTFLMLEAAEKFEKAFERLGDEDQKYTDYFDCYELNQEEECEGRKRKWKGNKIIGPPMEIDWMNARNFVKFLKIFYHVTLKFSGSSYITSNVFFRELATVHVGLSNMISKGDYGMVSMAIRMKEKFNKYWGNIDHINWLFFVAVLLDPRYKLKYVNFCFATMYQGDVSYVSRMTQKIEDLLVLLYKNYSDSNFQQTGKDENAVQDYYMQIDEEDDPSELLESQFARHLEEEQCVESKSEVARYLLDGFAKDVLAIPVSTIASESAFSTSGRVIDPFRSSLSPKMVEALICSQDWLRATPSSIDLHELVEDIEQFENIDKEFEGPNSSMSSDDQQE